MINIAIFASGSGTNAEKIMEHFASNSAIKISGVFSNKPDAFVLERASKFGVPSFTFDKKEFKEPAFAAWLKSMKIDFIVLAGFLWKIPENLIKSYPDKILNIHPALLPKFGGKGMYGQHVHQAVINAQESESGITIHLVNEQYDEGEILFQSSCPVTPKESPETLAQKIHHLEHEHFPKVIEEYVLSAI